MNYIVRSFPSIQTRDVENPPPSGVPASYYYCGDEKLMHKYVSEIYQKGHSDISVFKEEFRFKPQEITDCLIKIRN